MAATGTIGTTGTTTGWYPVARVTEVGTRPLPVGAGGAAFVVVRLRPGGEVSAFPARCPHRLVPLAAGTVVDGRHGWVWIAPERTTTPSPPRPSAEVAPEPAPAPPAPRGPVFGNLDPSLEYAWHPVALSRELRPGGWLQVRLLGRTWTVRRDGEGVSADPPAFGVRERFGLVWLAPAEPVDVPLELPEAADRRFVTGWLMPERSPGPAAPMADTFLDVAHGPFVHTDTVGAGHGRVDSQDVRYEPGGFTGVQEEWFDNVTDPEVAAGRRPLRQLCRATYVYRAPFQLRLRLTFPVTGATTTILHLLQPEDADSTRIYTRLLLSSGPGQPLPTPATVAAAVTLEQRVLEEDRAMQGVLATAGLPLDLRAELHLRSDRLGVALRRALCEFSADGRVRSAA
jgi:phenylpropionate dioxygenase-like ring-hydroxylating dioxygenase large terminal subunit